MLVGEKDKKWFYKFSMNKELLWELIHLPGWEGLESASSFCCSTILNEKSQFLL